MAPFTTVEKKSIGRERQRQRDKDGEIERDHRKLFFFTHESWRLNENKEHKKSVRREKAAARVPRASSPARNSTRKETFTRNVPPCDEQAGGGVLDLHNRTA